MQSGLISDPRHRSIYNAGGLTIDYTVVQQNIAVAAPIMLAMDKKTMGLNATALGVFGGTSCTFTRALTGPGHTTAGTSLVLS